MRALLLALVLVSCGPNPSGLTKAQAESRLREHSLTNITIGPSPKGWTGYAYENGYRVQVIVGENGAIRIGN